MRMAEDTGEIKGREPWLNSTQAAQHLGLKSVSALHKRMNKGDIPKKFIHRWGKSLRFKASELDQLINSAEQEERR